jgi:hypothetical protein
MRFFVESLFPEKIKGVNVVGRSKTSYIDVQNYQLNHLYRQGGTGRKNADTYKVLIPDEIKQQIYENPKLLLEVWKEPTQIGNTQDWIEGDFFWQQKEDAVLKKLWENCVDKAESHTKGSRVRVTTKESSPNGMPQGTSLTPYKVPQCIGNILSMIQEGSLQNRNNAFCILAQYYSSLKIFPDEQVEALLRDLSNQINISQGEWDTDFAPSIRNMLRKKYTIRCGVDTNGLSRLPFCNAEGSAKQCPCSIGNRFENRVMDTQAAFNKLIKTYTESLPFIKTNISDIDTVTGGLRDGDYIIMQGKPQSGKSVILNYLVEGVLEQVKARDEILLLSSPDQDVTGLSESFSLGKGKLTLQELWNLARQKQLPDILKEWFDSYKDHFYFVDGAGLTLDDHKKIVTDLEKSTGKRVGVFINDGLTYSISGDRSSTQKLANDTVSWVKSKKFVGIFVLHIPKGDVDAFDPESAFGSAFWNAQATVLSGFKYLKEFNVVSMAILKCKRRWKGEMLLPDPAGFVVAPWYQAIPIGKAVDHPKRVIRNYAIAYQTHLETEKQMEEKRNQQREN